MRRVLGLAFVVWRALRERSRPKQRPLHEELRELGERSANLPTLDDRDPEVILGYDDRGLPR